MRGRFSDLKAAHSKVIFITRVACETEDSERDRSGGQTGQCQLPLARVSLLQKSGKLQNCNL